MSDDTRVRELLVTATTDGLLLRIPGQLDRADYVSVNKTLEAMGGKWSRRDRAHVFKADPAPALAAFLGGGAAPKPARIAEGYVATPAALADEIVRTDTRVATLPAGATVLEPSAGDGALVRATLAANPRVHVVAIEPNWERAQVITRHPGTKVSLTVSQLEPFAATTSQRFDAVLMNPPFAMPGQPTVWIDHVRLAWSLLAPGGRLVAIVPAGFDFRQDRAHTAMRQFVGEYGGCRALSEDAFVSEGTAVRTFVLWLDRPASAVSA